MLWAFGYPMDTPWEGEKRRLAFHRMNTKPLVDLILDYKPDLCISTHFLGSEMISWLICKKRIETVNAIVVTDFDAHAMWFCLGITIGILSRSSKPDLCLVSMA